MPNPSDPSFRLTHALRNPDTAVAAAEALRGARGKAEVEGLAELIYAPPSARAATTAITSLEGCDHPLVLDALTAALDSPHTSVRLAAVQALHQCRATHAVAALVRLLDEDGARLVRRAALRAVADHPGAERWRILDAANDPHWRVRHALIRVLLSWGETETQRQVIDSRLSQAASDQRASGLRQYLLHCWFGRTPDFPPETETIDPGHVCPFWDWDAAVLARNLDRMGEAGRRQHIESMPDLLAHPDERVNGAAVEALYRWGEPRHIARGVALLDEPRTGAGEAVARLLGRLDMDRKEAAARLILHLPAPSPAQLAWAVDQAGEAFPAEEESDALNTLLKSEGANRPPVRRALARLARRWSHPDLRAEAASGDDEPPPERPRSEDHPHVRAAALTPASAAALLQNFAAETSWHVLARAARLARVPLWRFEPEKPWRPERRPRGFAEDLRPDRPAPLRPRVLGPAGLSVAPMGISGHYGLPVEGFVRAVEAGVNLFFWEPNYQTLAEFLTRLPASERNALHVVAGTFEADGPRVQRDAERALRLLKIDRLAVFLVFWVQSWARVAPDVRETLERLKATGKVASFGLSTHSRPLALEAMNAGWGPVMVRHSAAHRGAESQVLPHAAKGGTSLFTFNNTCYGRLLKPRGDAPAPSAADCYRYCLEQPGVTACWSAPATLEQLDENLTALCDPELPPDRRERLLAHGAWVYEEDVIFRKLVRSR